MEQCCAGNTVNTCHDTRGKLRLLVEVKNELMHVVQAYHTIRPNIFTNREGAQEQGGAGIKVQVCGGGGGMRGTAPGLEAILGICLVE